MLYKVKTIVSDESSSKKLKKSESMLKDLLTVIPTLKKHNLEGEILTQVRKLRSGRKTKKYTLELSRNFNGTEIKVSAPLPKTSDKIKIMRDLKAEIRRQIQEARRQQRPPIEQYTFRQGVVVSKLAEVYLEPGSFVKVMNRKIRQDMIRGKKPTTGDNYIGVEMELASKLTREQLCDKLFDAGLGKYVCVKDDGSIGSGTNLRTDHPHPHEICILVRQSEYVEIITKICKVLNEQCQVKVDKTCGLHVHLDMRNRDVKKSFHNLVNMQQFLYAMLPKARRDSRYSYPVKGSEYRILDSRYHGINTQAYDKYGTLEARMHCGTTQGNKIVNWVSLLIAIVDSPKAAYAPTTVEEMQTMIGINNELLDYIKSRVAKFASQHEGAKYTSEQPGTMPDIKLPAHAPIDTNVEEQSEVA